MGDGRRQIVHEFTLKRVVGEECVVEGFALLPADIEATKMKHNLKLRDDRRQKDRECRTEQRCEEM